MKSQGLKTTDNFLDIGCGTLRGGIPLIQYLNKGLYSGIDVREIAIREAKKELIDEKLIDKNPKIILFNKFNELTFEDKFDVILAFAVLFHLEDHILKDCLEFVKQNLKPNGKFYANIYPAAKSDGKWLDFPVVFRSLDFYQKHAEQNQLSIKVIDTMENLGHITNMPGDQQVMLEFSHSN